MNPITNIKQFKSGMLFHSISSGRDYEFVEFQGVNRIKAYIISQYQPKKEASIGFETGRYVSKDVAPKINHPLTKIFA